MQITLPFFNRQREYACGPESVKMISAVQSLRNITVRQSMLKVARTHGFVCRMSSNAVWEDVIGCLQNDVPAFINVRAEQSNEGRYAIVMGVKDAAVLLHDPCNDESFSLSVADFKTRWRGWMMTMTPGACGVHA